MTAKPVVTRVSQATRAVGSCSRTASSTASEIWSAILSGWPSVTDSDVKEKERFGMRRRLASGGSHALRMYSAHVLRVAKRCRFEIRVRRGAGVDEDRRLQPVLARVERRLHDAAFRRGPHDEDALDGLGTQQE